MKIRILHKCSASITSHLSPDIKETCGKSLRVGDILDVNLLKISGNDLYLFSLNLEKDYNILCVDDINVFCLEKENFEIFILPEK
jgi:hypothetical protein